MSRNRDAVRLAELKGIGYSAALQLIRDACDEAENEPQHAVAVRLLEAEEAKLRAVSLQHDSTSLFQEPS